MYHVFNTELVTVAMPGTATADLAKYNYRSFAGQRSHRAAQDLLRYLTANLIVRHIEPSRCATSVAYASASTLSLTLQLVSKSLMAPPNPCNSGRLLDFRSDTVTRPTPAMRQAAFEVWH